MSKLETTKDFRLKWEGRNHIKKQDLVEMIKDLFYIVEKLEQLPKVHHDK